MTAKTRTCLWFERGGLDAARFYTTLLPDSRVDGGDSRSEAEPMIVDFTLAGTPYRILNGGPHFPQSPAASIVVTTDDQPETDRLWAALTADGGSESMCGWLVDRWGVSWQIVPNALPALLGADDRAAAERARQAMLAMKKIDIAAMQAAFDGRGG